MTKFQPILSICSLNIELKQKSDISLKAKTLLQNAKMTGNNPNLNLVYTKFGEILSINSQDT